MSVQIFDVLTHDYNKEVDILNVTDTFTAAGSLSVTRDAGIYQVGMSVNWTSGATNDIALFRYRTQGGAWRTFKRETKDAAYNNVMHYEFPWTHAGGSFTMDIEVAKGSGSADLDVLFSNIWFTRVG